MGDDPTPSRTQPPAAERPPQGAADRPSPQVRAARGAQRRRLFAILGGAVLVVGVGWLLYWLLVGSHYVSTDDAYVGADVAQVTPLVAGAVREVRVQDTDVVRKGQVLVVIDPADAEVAFERTRAQYDFAQRQVRQDLSVGDQLLAGVAARDADLARARAQGASAESDLARAKVDLDRRQALAASGAVSGEELTTARNAYQTAEANLAAARAGLAQAAANRKAAAAQSEAQKALISGTTADTNPQAQTAKAALDAARLDLERTVLRAPIDGEVARRQVQVGQRVTQGVSLMSLVPLAQLYVDANFKEVQLKRIRIGQAASLRSDKYGGGTVFHGRVVGLGGGTGSAFAVIPAQNATGNWIKVVQRLPVRIRLFPNELRDHPLEVGLSMTATVNVSQSGER